MQVRQTEMDGAGLVVIAEDDESRSKSCFFFSFPKPLYYVVGCAGPSIPLLWLFRGYLKEESEGHRDAAALCLFKNPDV